MKTHPIPVLVLGLLGLASAQSVEVDGNLDVSGGMAASGAVISGSSPVRISTTASTVLDLRGNNPLMEWRSNSGDYLAFVQMFGSDFYLANREAGRMLFRTGNNDRMTISSSGNVGIGTTSPASRLTVNGFENDGAIGGLEVTSGSQKLIMDGNEIDCASGGLHLNHNSLNDVLVRTATRRSEVTMLHGNGSGVGNGVSVAHPGNNNVYWTLYSTNADGNLELYYKGSLRGEFDSGNGAYTQVSDRRLKENIRQLDGVLPRVARLNPAAYTFKDDAERNPRIGLIAQEVAEVFPELVAKGRAGDTGEEYYTMDYSALGVVALAATRELKQQMDAGNSRQLQAENQRLKERIGSLEERLARLEARVGGIADD